jgi:predicted lipoprotein with Yx(FWY)xxD motif
MVGTATLADGSMIVTYNHMPLYYWIKDKAPGDTTGQGNNDVWYVVAPNGRAVGMEATITVATDAKLGNILVDGKGMTLYMFTKDEPDKSNCSGKCIENWPALLTQGHPTLGEGVDASMVGTATLADGSMIVTYNHMPLYYFIKDKAPGDIVGQGNNNVWYVVAPDGNPVGFTNINANDNGNTNSNSNSNSNQNSNDNSGNDNGGGGNNNGNDNGGG